MKESTRTRLTIFSRLWPISMVLFIGLCVVGVIACMDEQKNLMGVAALGAVLMFLVQLSQLVASFIIRRWWCVVGSIIGIVLSIFVWICSIVALAAGQYRPPVREESASISDIMLIIADQEDPGEVLIYLKRAWKKHIRGEKHKGQFTLSDDYLMYAGRVEEDGFVWTDTTEFRSWDFQSGSNKLVAMAHRNYTNGEVACGQYSGISFYVFDGDTIEWVPDDAYGIEFPEINGIVVCRLSGANADITLTASNPEEGSQTKSFVWDGNRFVKLNK